MSSILAPDLDRRSGANLCVAQQSTPITFAVVGRNEALTLRRALRDACSAAGPTDQVMFVDSASEDDSCDVADAMGVRAVRAPAGKGRAMARALAETTTPYVCFIDADIHESSANIPAVLAAAVRTSRPDMVVGDFEDETGAVASVTYGVYEPLVQCLFPEAAGRYGTRPLGGFRALRTDRAVGQLPPDFGIEAHLNIVVALQSGARVAAVGVGRYRGRFLYKPRMGSEIGRAILDLAEARCRLDPVARPQWDVWLELIIDYIATYRGDRSRRQAFNTRLAELATRPLPSTR